jgi:hypothetical protein
VAYPDPAVPIGGKIPDIVTGQPAGISRIIPEIPEGITSGVVKREPALLAAHPKPPKPVTHYGLDPVGLLAAGSGSILQVIGPFPIQAFKAAQSIFGAGPDGTVRGLIYGHHRIGGQAAQVAGLVPVAFPDAFGWIVTT